MAGNPYAVDFSELGTAIKGFKDERHKRKIKKETDSLIKKREGMDELLGGQSAKQRQLMADTPEMDQTSNTVDLNAIQEQRLQARRNKYNELGGLSAKDFKGMTTEAVDAFKARVAGERVASRAREDQQTADALVTYEAMGRNPKYLKDWFNETQAHKWGLADGVDRFEVSGENVLVYENGKDYGQAVPEGEAGPTQGNVPTVIPKEQFDMFATSALNPESTKLMAKSLQEGNIPIIVQANRLKEMMSQYDTLEEARVAMGISDADFKKMMGVDTAKEILKEYINVVEDGEVKGMQLGTNVEGKAFRREGPPKQVSSKGAGKIAESRIKFANLLLKAKESRQKSDDKVLTGEYGGDFFDWSEDLNTFVPKIPKIRSYAKAEIKKAETFLETNPGDVDATETIRKHKQALSIMTEGREQALRTDDAVRNIIDGLNNAYGDIGGFAEENLAGPAGLEQTTGFTAPTGTPQSGKAAPMAVAHENTVVASDAKKKKKIEDIQKRLKNKLAGNK